MAYKERCLFSQEKRWLWGDSITDGNYFSHGLRQALSRLFSKCETVGQKTMGTNRNMGNSNYIFGFICLVSYLFYLEGGEILGQRPRGVVFSALEVFRN